MQGPGAIVIGGYVNGLGMVRALAARGVPTAVITTKPYDIAQRSRYCVAQHTVSGLEERPEALVEALDALAGRFAGWALLPTNDEALVALALHRDRLAATYRVVAPPWQVTRQLIEKTLLLDAARAAGVAVPYCYGPATDATAASPELRFPVLVKPVIGYRFYPRFGVKLFVARNRAELQRAVARLRDADLDGEVFDLVPGGDDHIYSYSTYVDAGGAATAGVTIRKLRQSPPLFGVARVAEVIDEIPLLRDATLAIVRQLGFQGIAGAEFKRDPRDGCFRFLEMNGRSTLYNALLRKAGLDLAAIAWSEHVAGRLEVPVLRSWRGVWINLHADLLYTTFARRDERLGIAAFVAPYARPMVEAVWSAADPYPFFAQWGRSAQAFLRREHRGQLAGRSHLAPGA